MIKYIIGISIIFSTLIATVPLKTFNILKITLITFTIIMFYYDTNK